MKKKQKLAKVWQTYKALPEKFENVMIIDGEKSIKEVFESVLFKLGKEMESKLKN